MNILWDGGRCINTVNSFIHFQMRVLLWVLEKEAFLRAFVAVDDSSHVPTVMFADIPDDEAQYWTSKLEWINTMSIDEEVKTKSRPGCALLRPCSRVSSLLQYPPPDESHPLPFAASQCCEYLRVSLRTTRWSPLLTLHRHLAVLLPTVCSPFTVSHFHVCTFTRQLFRMG